MSVIAGAGWPGTFLSMTSDIGGKIARLLSKARERILIISAFVRGDALSRILSDANPNVQVGIFARWRLSDLMSGASDLSAFDIARKRGAEFRIHSALHAKAFIADNSALVGSANVTMSAFGESDNPNAEILVPSPAGASSVESLIEFMLAQGTVVTEDYVARLRDVIQAGGNVADAGAFSPQPPESDNWLPMTPIPQDFLDFLFFRQLEHLRESAKMLAMRDCCALGLSVGAEKYENIPRAIIQRRLFRELKDRILSSSAASSMTDDMGAKFLVESYGIPESESDAQWKIVKEWLRAFLPNEFIVIPTGGEEVRIGKRLR